MLIAQRRCNFHKLRLIVNTSLKDQLKSQPGLRLVSSQGGWYAHCPAIAPPKLHIGSRAGSLLLHEKSSIFDTRTHIALYCCTGRAFDPDKTGHREAIGQAFEGISYYPPSPIFFCLTIWHPQQRNWKDCVACYVVVTGYSKTPNIAKHTTGLGGGSDLATWTWFQNIWELLPADEIFDSLYQLSPTQPKINTTWQTEKILQILGGGFKNRSRFLAKHLDKVASELGNDKWKKSFLSVFLQFCAPDFMVDVRNWPPGSFPQTLDFRRNPDWF